MRVKEGIIPRSRGCAFFWGGGEPHCSYRLTQERVTIGESMKILREIFVLGLANGIVGRVARPKIDLRRSRASGVRFRLSCSCFGAQKFL